MTAGSSVPEAARAAVPDEAVVAALEDNYPKEVTCPTCASAEDDWCHDGSGLTTGFHRARFIKSAVLAAAPFIVAAAVAEERATTGRRIEAAARKHIVQLEAERPPCDEGCQDYPEETCSRHGRKVREVWEMLAALNTRIEAVLRLCEDAEMHQHVPPDTPLGPWVSTRPLRAALASPGEGE